MRPVHEMTVEERCRHYEKEMSRIQTALWLDTRIPMEVVKELDKQLCELRGLPF